MAAPPSTTGRADYRGWLAGLVVIVLVVAVAFAFWFRYHP